MRVDVPDDNQHEEDWARARRGRWCALRTARVGSAEGRSGHDKAAGVTTERWTVRRARARKGAFGFDTWMSLLEMERASTDITASTAR